MASNILVIILFFYFFIIYGLAGTIDNVNDFDAMASKYGWKISTACRNSWNGCIENQGSFDACFNSMTTYCMKPTTPTTTATIPTTTRAVTDDTDNKPTISISGTVDPYEALAEKNGWSSRAYCKSNWNFCISFRTYEDCVINMEQASCKLTTTTKITTTSPIPEAAPTVTATETVAEKTIISSIIDPPTNSKEEPIPSITSPTNLLSSFSKVASPTILTTNFFPISKQNVQSLTTQKTLPSTDSSNDDESSSSTVLALSSTNIKPSSSEMTPIIPTSRFEQTSTVSKKFSIVKETQLVTLSGSISSVTMQPVVTSKKSFIESTIPTSLTPRNLLTSSNNKVTNDQISSKVKSTSLDFTISTNLTTETTTPVAISTKPSEPSKISSTVNDDPTSTDLPLSSSSELSQDLLKTTMPINKMPLSSSTEMAPKHTYERSDSTSSLFLSKISSTSSPSSPDKISSIGFTASMNSKITDDLETSNVKTTLDLTSPLPYSTTQSSLVSSTQIENELLTKSSPGTETTLITNSKSYTENPLSTSSSVLKISTLTFSSEQPLTSLSSLKTTEMISDEGTTEGPSNIDKQTEEDLSPTSSSSQNEVSRTTFSTSNAQGNEKITDGKATISSLILSSQQTSKNFGSISLSSTFKIDPINTHSDIPMTPTTEIQNEDVSKPVSTLKLLGSTSFLNLITTDSQPSSFISSSHEAQTLSPRSELVKISKKENDFKTSESMDDFHSSKVTESVQTTSLQTETSTQFSDLPIIKVSSNEGSTPSPKMEASPVFESFTSEQPITLKTIALTSMPLTSPATPMNLASSQQSEEISSKLPSAAQTSTIPTSMHQSSSESYETMPKTQSLIPSTSSFESSVANPSTPNNKNIFSTDKTSSSKFDMSTILRNADENFISTLPSHSSTNKFSSTNINLELLGTSQITKKSSHGALTQTQSTEISIMDETSGSKFTASPLTVVKTETETTNIPFIENVITFKQTDRESTPTIIFNNDAPTSSSVDDKPITTSNLADFFETSKKDEIYTTLPINPFSVSNPFRSSTAEKIVKLKTEQLSTPGFTNSYTSESSKLVWDKTTTNKMEIVDNVEDPTTTSSMAFSTVKPASTSTKEFEKEIPLTKGGGLQSTESSASSFATITASEFGLTPPSQMKTALKSDAMSSSGAAAYSQKATSESLADIEISQIPFSTKESSSIKQTTISLSDSEKIHSTTELQIEQDSSIKTTTKSKNSEFGSSDSNTSPLTFTSDNQVITQSSLPATDGKMISTSGSTTPIITVAENFVVDVESSSKPSTIVATFETDATPTIIKSLTTGLSDNIKYDSSSTKLDIIKDATTTIAKLDTSKSHGTMKPSFELSQKVSTTTATATIEKEIPMASKKDSIVSSSTDRVDFETTEQQKFDKFSIKTPEYERQGHSKNSLESTPMVEANTLSSIVVNEDATMQTAGPQSAPTKITATPFEEPKTSLSLDESELNKIATQITQGTDKFSTPNSQFESANPAVDTTLIGATESITTVKLDPIKANTDTSKHFATSKSIDFKKPPSIDGSSFTLTSQSNIPSTESTDLKVSSETSTLAEAEKITSSNDVKLNTVSLIDTNSKIYSSKGATMIVNAKTSQASNIETTMPDSGTTTSIKLLATTPLSFDNSIKSTSVAIKETKITGLPTSDDNEILQTTTKISDPQIKVSLSSVSSDSTPTNFENAPVSTASLPSSILLMESGSSSTNSLLPATIEPSCETTVCPIGFIESYQSCFKWLDSASSKGYSYNGFEKICLAIRDDAVMASLIDYENPENVKLFKQMRDNSKLNNNNVFSNSLGKNIVAVIDIDKINGGNKSYVSQYSVSSKSPRNSAICRVGKKCDKYACDLNEYMASPSAEYFGIKKGTKSVAMPNETVTVYCNFENPFENFEIKCDRKGYFVPDAAASMANCSKDKESPLPTAIVIPEPQNIKFEMQSCDQCSAQNTISCGDNNNGKNLTCECEELFSGSTCNQIKDECANMTCMNGGKAISNLFTSCTCICPAEYFGEKCEIYFYNSSYAAVYNYVEQGITFSQVLAGLMNMRWSSPPDPASIIIPIEVCRSLITECIILANTFKLISAVPISASLEDMSYCNLFFWASAIFFFYSLTIMCAESLISYCIITGRWSNLFQGLRPNRNNSISFKKFHFWTVMFTFVPLGILWISSATFISHRSCMGSLNYMDNISDGINNGTLIYPFLVGIYTLFACVFGLMARFKINMPQYEIRRRYQTTASGLYAYGRELYPVEFSVRYCIPMLRPLFLSLAWFSAIYSRESLTFYSSAISTGIAGVHAVINFVQSQTSIADAMDFTIERAITWMPRWMPRCIARFVPTYNPVTLQTRDEILRICEPKQWKEEMEKKAAQQHPDAPKIVFPQEFNQHIERDGPLKEAQFTFGWRLGFIRYEKSPWNYDLSLMKRTIPLKLQRHLFAQWNLIYLENRANGYQRWESMKFVLIDIKTNYLADYYIPHSRIVALFKNFMKNMVHLDQLKIKNSGSHQINIEAQEVFQRGVLMLKLQMTSHIEAIELPNDNNNSEWLMNSISRADPLLTEEKQQEFYDLLDSVCNGINLEDIVEVDKQVEAGHNHNDANPGAAYIVADNDNRDLEANIDSAVVVFKEVASENRINNSMFNVAYIHDFQNNVFDPLIEETLEPVEEENNDVAVAELQPFSLHEYLLDERRPNFVGPRTYSNQIPPGITLLQYTAFYCHEINNAIWKPIQDRANLDLFMLKGEERLKENERIVTKHKKSMAKSQED